MARQAVCARCKRVTTRYWVQFMSLMTIFVAVLCNTVLGLFLLPRLAMAQHGRGLFRGWYWFDQKFALYGWVPLAIGLLAWDYFIWKEARPKVKGWFTPKLLTFSLAAGIAPLLPCSVDEPGDLVVKADAVLVMQVHHVARVVVILFDVFLQGLREPQVLHREFRSEKRRGQIEIAVLDLYQQAWVGDHSLGQILIDIGRAREKSPRSSLSTNPLPIPSSTGVAIHLVFSKF